MQVDQVVAGLVRYLTDKKLKIEDFAKLKDKSEAQKQIGVNPEELEQALQALLKADSASAAIFSAKAELQKAGLITGPIKPAPPKSLLQALQEAPLDVRNEIIALLVTNLEGQSPTQDNLKAVAGKILSADGGKKTELQGKLTTQLQKAGIEPSTSGLDVMLSKIAAEPFTLINAVNDVSKKLSPQEAKALLLSSDQIRENQSFAVKIYFNGSESAYKTFEANLLVHFKVAESIPQDSPKPASLAEALGASKTFIEYFESLARKINDENSRLKGFVEKRVQDKEKLTDVKAKMGEVLALFPENRVRAAFLTQLNQELEKIAVISTSQEASKAVSGVLDELVKIFGLPESAKGNLLIVLNAVAETAGQKIEEPPKTANQSDSKKPAQATDGNGNGEKQGIWERFGNIGIIVVGALAAIGGFLSESPVGKFFASIGLAAVVGGLVARFSESIGWIFGVNAAPAANGGGNSK